MAERRLASPHSRPALRAGFAAGLSFADERGVRIVKRVALVIIAIVVLGVGYRVLGVYRFRSGECSAR